MRNVTFTTTFTAESNASGKAEVFANTEGPAFQVDRVTMYKNGGNVGEVKVGTFVGERRLAPDNAPLAVGRNPVSMEAEESVGPDATVEARYENTSGSDRDVVVLVHGMYNEE